MWQGTCKLQIPEIFAIMHHNFCIYIFQFSHLLLMTSNGKLLAGHSPSTLPLASAGSVYLKSITSCSTRMKPASTKGQNFFHTVTTKPLYFSKIKNLNDSKLDALSKFQIKIFFITFTTTQIYIPNLYNNLYSILVFLQSFILYLYFLLVLFMLFNYNV